MTWFLEHRVDIALVLAAFAAALAIMMLAVAVWYVWKHAGEEESE